MKTLVLEPDPMRARGWMSLYGGAKDVVDVARSSAQARIMLISERYDRLCFTAGAERNAGYALLSVARAMNPECEVIDLASQRVRLATGPLVDSAAELGGDRP